MNRKIEMNIFVLISAIMSFIVIPIILMVILVLLALERFGIIHILTSTI